MARYFNTTGPCRPEMHYMLPPADRLVGAHLPRYIRDQLYWVLHAPRQTGKTTFLQTWAKEINETKQGVACYVSVEHCQGVPEAEAAMPAICNAVRTWAKHFELPIPQMPKSPVNCLLGDIMTNWAELVAPQPLIILFDEVDVLSGHTLTSFLRQLRGGFAGRGIGKFPVSIALVGMRDLRDYLTASKGGEAVNPGSPFNIKQDSATLTCFSEENIGVLTAQHTAETGQKFSPDALEKIWHYSSGQPWLVNKLCDLCVNDFAPNGEEITPAHIEQAKEQLILSRATHLDALAERLKLPKVKRVVEPIIIGASDPNMAEGDDFMLCLDLGLVTVKDGSPAIANAIYREVLARVLSYGYQMAIAPPEFPWQNEDGSLAMARLMQEFQKFWAWHGDLWEEKADYTEAFPHLLLMAFLQRVINGGGIIHREYAAGRGRVDLGIEFGGKVNIIEIKLVHPKMGREMTKAQGLEQIERYAATLPADTLDLVIFDRRQDWREKPIDERLSQESATTPSGQTVTVSWC